MNTLELQGPALNYAVAVALGRHVRFWPAAQGIRKTAEVSVLHPNTEWGVFDPVDNWAIAGPMLDEADIDTRRAFFKSEPDDPNAYYARLSVSTACPTGGSWYAPAHGPTRLIAGLRCLVRSKLGDEVDIPKELL